MIEAHNTLYKRDLNSDKQLPSAPIWNLLERKVDEPPDQLNHPILWAIDMLLCPCVHSMKGTPPCKLVRWYWSGTAECSLFTYSITPHSLRTFRMRI